MNYAKHFILSLVIAFGILNVPFISLAAGELQASSTQVVTPKASKNKLCLTMIVKNESRIIERCLNSVKGIVDCVSICDTGSTDNTVALIESFLEKNHIPGKVHNDPWKNFGYNRTNSALLAQKTLVDLGFPLERTYLLFLDADMLLEVSPNFNKDALIDDSYLMIQRSCSLSYYNLRLARASLTWDCVGVTHEYWASKGNVKRGQIETLVIDDKEDGGCKADKFERDVRLLTQGLKDEPNNERYMFYLAQSYKCLRQFDDSIKWYKERIAKGGWKEEVFYAKYMIGECYEGKNDWEKALTWYLDAYQTNPKRAETLQKIANHYRNANQNDLAYMFAAQGKKIPYPTEEILFVSHPVYNYQFDEEISIAGFYTPQKNEGYDSLNKLLLSKDVPSHVKGQAQNNLMFYVEKLKNAELKKVDVEAPLLKKGLPDTYKPMNPSIVKTENGYDVNCRFVNYIQKGAKEYKFLDTDDYKECCITKNILIHYDKNFKRLSQEEIVEDLPRQRVKGTWLSDTHKGFEDLRIFRLNNKTMFTATTFDTNSQNRQISLGRLEDKPSKGIVKVDKLVPLKGPDPARCEKNWLPFVKDGELLIVYNYNPFSIVKPNFETGELTTVVNYVPKHDFSSFRGSSAPVEFDKGYLAVVHEVIFKDRRYYTHRFIYLDKNFNITRVSKPFTFKDLSVEYACGMTMNHEGNKMIVSVGIEDAEAQLCFIDLSTIRKLLEPLPK
jgi:glycosyltransferase involved in cell wall biosynthesis